MVKITGNLTISRHQENAKMIKLSKKEYNKAFKELSSFYGYMKYRKDHCIFYWERDILNGYYIN